MSPSPLAPYIGRFAPSPSGLLHLGSLTSALASYLDAKQHEGEWLLRIEDIDPPREEPGAAQAIIHTLASHGLESDRPVFWQSQRGQTYRDWLDYLQAEKLAYACDCNRLRLTQLAHRYDGHCRTRQAHVPYALRLKVTDLPANFAWLNHNIQFLDRHQGEQCEDLGSSGDFIIHRKDGLFAYQLAVVLDDIEQGITHVVRGNDLLDTTARQIFLFNLLKKTPPSYCHIPVLCNSLGQKLSKQNRALPLNPNTPGRNIGLALRALGAQPPQLLDKAPPRELLNWALANWSIKQLPCNPTVAEHSFSLGD